MRDVLVRRVDRQCRASCWEKQDQSKLVIQDLSNVSFYFRMSRCVRSYSTDADMVQMS